MFFADDFYSFSCSVIFYFGVVVFVAVDLFGFFNEIGGGFGYFCDLTFWASLSIGVCACSLCEFSVYFAFYC